MDDVEVALAGHLLRAHAGQSSSWSITQPQFAAHMQL